MNEDVARKFSTYPEDAKTKLHEIRQLIFDVAAGNPNVAKLEETLKWGEPAYLSKSGSTIRIDWKSEHPDQVAMHVICTTSLMEDFVAQFPGVFKTEGDRALLFSIDEPLPTAELEACIDMALTYKL